MVATIAKQLDRPESEADTLLAFLEKTGMRPPMLDEDKVQALMSVYYGGYTINQWDEDFEKDAAAVSALDRRKNRKIKYED